MMMRGCGVDRADGTVSVLELAEPPDPGPGEVLIAVQAAGMGPWDALLYTGGWDVGLQYPAALGVEGSGSVLAVGADVTALRVGDQVLAHDAPLPKGSGFWAEQTLINAQSIARRPAGLDPVSAGGLPIAGLTARQVIDALNIGAGFRLLITGGAGVTGAVVVQLAAAAGVQVTVTASDYHTDRLTALGAHAVVDYHRSDWPALADGPFDAAVIAAPGTGADAIALVRDRGVLLTLTGDAPASERGIQSSDFYVEPNGPQLEEIANLVTSGDLTLNTQPVTLDDAVTTFDTVAAGATKGRKMVLTFAT
jgi:NADPH:quinone reductase-like Zn-dependent oxidoreductase